MLIKYLFCIVLLLVVCVVVLLVMVCDVQVSFVVVVIVMVVKLLVFLLWKVIGLGDVCVYLLGLFYLLKLQDYLLLFDVEQVFEVLQWVVFELLLEDM